MTVKQFFKDNKPKNGEEWFTVVPLSLMTMVVLGGFIVLIYHIPILLLVFGGGGLAIWVWAHILIWGIAKYERYERRCMDKKQEQNGK